MTMLTSCAILVVVFSIFKAFCAGVALPLCITSLVATGGFIIHEVGENSDAKERAAKNTDDDIDECECDHVHHSASASSSSVPPVGPCQTSGAIDEAAAAPISTTDTLSTDETPSPEAKSEKIIDHKWDKVDGGESELESEHDSDCSEDDFGFRKNMKLAEKEEPIKREYDIPKAVELKEKGNEFFKAGNYDEAQEAYSDAILWCSEEEKELYSTLFSNRAACYQYLENWDLVIRDATKAIEIREDFVKAYHRRCKAYEMQDKMQDALSDLKKILELDPSQRPRMEAHLKVIEQKAAVQFEREKTEMMGKLKELGNSVLGNFGMSLDNFNWVQDPATGSYSVSYNNN